MLATLSDMPEALRGYQSPHAQARPAPRVGAGHGAKRACAWGWGLAVVAHVPGWLRTAGEKARVDVEPSDAILPSRRHMGYYGTDLVPGPRPSGCLASEVLWDADADSGVRYLLRRPGRPRACGAGSPRTVRGA